MKNREQVLREYLEYSYDEMVDDQMYAPDVYQTTLDFNTGWNSAQKKIKDKINYLKSDLAQEKIIKPSKTLNTEKIKQLEESIKLLEGLI